ncbi:unnamed protein product [Didymodactylos carnosus]|uniref:Uncharacterized protein n=1 Tax=Didymodactylos carnosus TaxID=1234261 RepID=A0A813PWI6_9BILA|nr:unnamed protein product [Didymodactylos carnosus]CAF1051484.1 unnamed protein product [Didymodactylos carnosus]CAF3539466.1 unnamed protein product [Didymodactylos carnosus]CAF3818204.1 unnamed protein product [Didymodactylos carnosus]
MTEINENLVNNYMYHGRRTIIKEFFSNTSIHGLPSIAKSHNLKNCLFWTIAFLIFTGLMIYFIILTILDYLKYTTQTKVKIINEWPMHYPAFTICPASPYRSDLFEEPFLNYTNSSVFLPSANLGNNINQFAIDMINIGGMEKLTEYAFLLSDMLISCTYNGFKCNESDFIWFASASYGICYTFNAKTANKSILYTNTNGGQGLLELELYVHENIYVDYVTDSVGIVTMIHDNTQMPQVEFGGIALSPGRKHMLIYTKKETAFLESPYTTCTRQVWKDMYALYKQFGAQYEYSQMVCLMLCQETSVYATCGCISPNYWYVREILVGDNVITVPICDISNECYLNATVEFMNDEDLQTMYCSHCTSQCEITSFIVQSSSFKSPLDWKMQSIKQSVEQMSNKSFNSRPIALPSDWDTNWIDYIDKNYVAIAVVRGSYLVDYFTQKATLSGVDVLSNVGGLIGLWLGGSLLSVFELYEMFYRIIRRHIRKRKEDAKPNSAERLSFDKLV